MKAFCSFLWIGATAVVFTTGSIGLDAQAVIPAHKSNLMLVTVAMEKKQVHVGESPKVILMIENLSDHAFEVNGCPPERFFVQGEKGEPPTTFIERDDTDRLLPGEAPLMCNDMGGPIVNPGGTQKLSAELKYFYDLTAPGKYSVYVEIPSAEGWLRTDPVDFEILPADPVAKKESK